MAGREFHSLVTHHPKWHCDAYENAKEKQKHKYGLYPFYPLPHGDWLDVIYGRELPADPLQHF